MPPSLAFWTAFFAKPSLTRDLGLAVSAFAQPVLPEVGSVIAGKYRLLDSLGEGGMGAVFEAEHVLTHKHAAIKWLHPGHLGHDEVLRRLLHEARASARVRHHNVVDVYDVLTEGRAVALVMELLTGEPLSARIARGDLSFHELLQLLVPAMRGVAAAHAAGVVHRDVKPDNIFLAREAGHVGPVPKVIDFGISKVTDAGSEGFATRSGITMGTPRYVSYEQLAGYKDVDGRTDIYAFGVILYEGLTGRAPYEDASTFSQQALLFATSTPQPPSALCARVPADLNAFIMVAIERDRDQRLSTMEELIAGLEPFLGARVGELPDAHARIGNAPQCPALPAPGQTTTPAFETKAAVPSAGAPAPSTPAPAMRKHPLPRSAWLWLSALIMLLGFAIWVSLSSQLEPVSTPAASGTRRERTTSERPVAPPPHAEHGVTAPAAPIVHTPPATAADGVVNKQPANPTGTWSRREPRSRVADLAATEIAPVAHQQQTPTSNEATAPANVVAPNHTAERSPAPSAGSLSRDEF